jgi:hypothetical protein
MIPYWQTLVIASLYSEPDATSLKSQFQKFLISVIFVAIANLSNILATCARVIVWYGINDSVVLYEVIHMSYIQLIASMNSGELVKVSFPAIISRLTELPESTVLQLAAVIQFESGLLVSIVGS